MGLLKAKTSMLYLETQHDVVHNFKISVEKWENRLKCNATMRNVTISVPAFRYNPG